VASRRSVRTTAACRLFPLGEALPSTTSAGSCLYGTPMPGAGAVHRIKSSGSRSSVTSPVFLR
jgi:hypothetical protein